ADGRDGIRSAASTGPHAGRARRDSTGARHPHHERGSGSAAAVTQVAVKFRVRNPHVTRPAHGGGEITVIYSGRWPTRCRPCPSNTHPSTAAWQLPMHLVPLLPS